MYEFFVAQAVGYRRYTTDQRTMSVDQLRRFTGTPATYSCWQETPVQARLEDRNAVDLTCSPRLMFVPPAGY